MMLAGINFDAGTGLHIIQFTPAELAIASKFLNAVEHIPIIDCIGIALVHQLLYHRDDLRDCLADPRVHIGALHIQFIHGFEISLDIAPGNITPGNTLFISRIDDLIINIRKILDVVNLIALLRKITADDIPGHERTGIADMRMVVWRNSAAIDADLALFKRLERLLLTGHRIIDFKHSHVSPYL